MLTALKERTRRESPTRFSDISLKRYKNRLRSKKTSGGRMSCDDEGGTMGQRDEERGLMGPRSASACTLGADIPERPYSPHVFRLDSVAAKMAGIESSLSPARRLKKNALPVDGVKDAQVLVADSQGKDHLIQTLQSQLLMVRKQFAQCQDRPRERTALQERLTALHTQIEQKKACIKNLKLCLEKLDMSENIDICIRRAELEYEVEREELNLLNLQAEALSLKSNMEDLDNSNHTPRVSLTSCLPSGADTTLVLARLHYDVRSPSFTVSTHISGLGALVEWGIESSGLRRGDRFLEVNGHDVFGYGRERLVRFVCQLTAGGSGPLQLLLVRCQAERAAVRELGLQREETQLLAERLEQKTRENKELHALKERYSGEAEVYLCENIRLTHRIGYLEDQVHEMQADLDKIKGVTDESLRRAKHDVHVFTKGPHTATIPVNVEQSAVRDCYVVEPAVAGHHTPPSTCSRSSAVSTGSRPSHAPPPLHIYQNVKPRLKEKPRNIFQRLQHIGERRGSASDHEGRCSLGPLRGRSSAAAGSVTDSESCHGSVVSEKPRPPRKPARLSLQRTTSVQSVQSEDVPPPSTSGWRRRPQCGIQTWPSIDQHLNHSGSSFKDNIIHSIGSIPRLTRRSS